VSYHLEVEGFAAGERKVLFHKPEDPSPMKRGFMIDDDRHVTGRF
jgi:hypothetical protein